MKKSKFIGIGVATLGVVMSIGVSIALYTKGATAINFGIGGFEYEGAVGDINYKLGVETISDAATPANPTQTIKVPLSAVYPNGVIAQDAMAGNLSITVDADDDLENKLSVTAIVKGYEAGSYWANTSSLTTLLSAASFTGEQLTASKDISVKAGDANPTILNGNQYLEVTLTYTLTDNTMLSLAEKQVSVNVLWDTPSNEYVPAYIKGDANSWQSTDEYQMVADLHEDTWQWKFQNLTGFTKLKVYKAGEPEKWVGDGNGGSDDITVDPALTYQVYWKEDQTSLTPNDYNAVHYISHVSQ